MKHFRGVTKMVNKLGMVVVIVSILMEKHIALWSE